MEESENDNRKSNTPVEATKRLFQDLKRMGITSNLVHPPFDFNPTKNLLLSEQDILQRGKITNVALALDDGDDHHTSGHWLNTSGTRMYSDSRVKLAEELISDFQDGCYYHTYADELNSMSLPVTEPFIIIDYRIISKHIDAGLTKKINLLKISHPFLGRRPGSEKKEKPLVIRALINIANYSNPTLSISNAVEFYLYLESLSNDAEQIFPAPWPNSMVRQQILKRNIYRGKSPKAALKLLQILSLLYKGYISTDLLDGNPSDLVSFLVKHPLLRIDHKINRLNQ